MKNAERMGTLLFRFVRKELNREEEKELTAWRYASAENEKLFQEKTDKTKIVRELADYLETRDHIFQKIKERYPDPWIGPALGRPRRVIQIMKFVVMAMIVLGTGWYLILSMAKKEIAVQPGRYQAVLIPLDGIPRSLDDFHRGFLLGKDGIQIEKMRDGELLYITPNDTLAPKDKYMMLYTLRGGQFSLRLPDGTQIWLNAQSSIKYPANFSQDSVLITLEGEAYFEIAEKSTHRLRIVAGETLTEASDAQVNIMSYPDEKEGITLAEGSAVVLLNPGAAGKNPTKIILRPYDQVKLVKWPMGAVLERDHLPLGDVEDIIAWKNGRTSFRDVSIQTIMRAISRWYDTDIIYKGDIPGQPYSLHLPRSAGLYRVISDLEKQGGHFLVQGKTITVSK
jgi:transmembrane sensor